MLIILGICPKSFSQYEQMLNNSAWAVEVATFGGSQMYTIDHAGQTVIGTQGYLKYATSWSQEFLLREDVAAKKVYKYVNGAEILLFDFSLNLSDYTVLSNGNTYQVSSITNVNVNGGQRRSFYLTNISNPFGYDELWIEGVGSVQHPLLANYELFSDPAFYLKCSYQNSTNIYNQGTANGGTPTNCSGLGVDEQFIASTIIVRYDSAESQLVIDTEHEMEQASCKIYTIAGQLAATSEGLSGTHATVDNLRLSSGIYLVTLTAQGNRVVKKIAVK
jgi:hypothetical protein